MFASESSTPTQVATDLSGQLGRSVPGFTELARAYERAASEEEWNGLDALHRQVVGPLSRHEGDPIRIVIDAIDQLPEDSSAPVRAALPALADMGVRIVVTARPGVRLPERAEQFRIRAADNTAVGAYLEGRSIGGDVAREFRRWLRVTGWWCHCSPISCPLGTSTCLGSPPARCQSTTVPSRRLAPRIPTWQYQYRPILTVLAAAGTGPVLPMPLLRLASEKLGGPSRTGRVRDTLMRLRQLVVRGRPDTQMSSSGFSTRR